MPKFLENVLQKAAAAKGLKGDAADKYTFGALNNMGAMKGAAETLKGKAMQKKHDAKLSAAQAAKIRRKADAILG
jgi:hypothetical protein